MITPDTNNWRFESMTVRTLYIYISHLLAFRSTKISILISLINFNLKNFWFRKHHVCNGYPSAHVQIFQEKTRFGRRISWRTNIINKSPSDQSQTGALIFYPNIEARRMLRSRVSTSHQAPVDPGCFKYRWSF